MSYSLPQVKAKIDAERERCVGVIAARTERPGQAFWLSFADEAGFRGVVVIHGEDFTTAVLESALLGINPGGEVRGMEIDSEIALTIPEHWKSRLLTRQDCEALDAEMLKIQQVQ